MTYRRLLYRLHWAVGLTAGLWLAMVGVTGSLLVFGREIDTLLAADLYCVTPAEARLTLDSVIDHLRQKFPTEPVFRVRLPQQASESLEVWLESTTGRRVFVDPYRGRILGVRHPQASLLGIVRSIHVELLLGGIGRWIVGGCGGCLLFLGASGLSLWWPGWRGLRHAFQWRSHVSRHVGLYLWHRAIGVPAAPLLLVSAATGLPLVFDHTALVAASWVGRMPVPPVPPRLEFHTAPPHAMSLEEALQRARDALPDGTTTWIWLPHANNGALAVRRRGTSEWHPNGRSFVYFDPHTRHVLAVIDATTSADASRITNQMYPLHTGAVGGPLMRTVVLITGITPALLCLTGIGSWWLRRCKRRHR